MLEGIVRDVRGLFTNRDKLFDTYVHAQRMVWFGIRDLERQIRSEQIDEERARILELELAKDIDRIIREHPHRFREWNAVKKEAQFLKKELVVSVNESIKYVQFGIPADARRLFRDQIYETVPRISIFAPPAIPQHARETYRTMRELTPYALISTEHTAQKSTRPALRRSTFPLQQNEAGFVQGLIAGTMMYFSLPVIAQLYKQAHHYAQQLTPEQWTSMGKTVVELGIAGCSAALAGYAMNRYTGSMQTKKSPEPHQPCKINTFNTRAAAGMLTISTLVGMFMSSDADARKVLPLHKARKVVEQHQRVVFYDDLPFDFFK